MKIEIVTKGKLSKNRPCIKGKLEQKRKKKHFWWIWIPRPLLSLPQKITHTFPSFAFEWHSGNLSLLNSENTLCYSMHCLWESKNTLILFFTLFHSKRCVLVSTQLPQHKVSLCFKYGWSTETEKHKTVQRELSKRCRIIFFSSIYLFLSLPSAYAPPFVCADREQ